MSHRLSFTDLLRYNPGAPGIDVPIILRNSQSEISLNAKLDTGSSHCFFQRVHGENLGLDIETGRCITVGIAVGSFLAYGHSITLCVGDFTFDVLAYFARDYSVRRNVLGRQGFLNLVRLGLIDYDGRLYLSLYDDLSDSE